MIAGLARARLARLRPEGLRAVPGPARGDVRVLHGRGAPPAPARAREPHDAQQRPRPGRGLGAPRRAAPGRRVPGAALRRAQDRRRRARRHRGARAEAADLPPLLPELPPRRVHVREAPRAAEALHGLRAPVPRGADAGHPRARLRAPPAGEPLPRAARAPRRAEARAQPHGGRRLPGDVARERRGETGAGNDVRRGAAAAGPRPHLHPRDDVCQGGAILPQ
mmetsp:Transcript_18511/g.60515  ORF Transcript_18511/g.60515 Transcript_18511/m.60515 type:complete len:222 (+) Transcript_18511:1580-2245(+)